MPVRIPIPVANSYHIPDEIPESNPPGGLTVANRVPVANTNLVSNAPIMIIRFTENLRFVSGEQSVIGVAHEAEPKPVSRGQYLDRKLCVEIEDAGEKRAARKTPLVDITETCRNRVTFELLERALDLRAGSFGDTDIQVLVLR